MVDREVRDAGPGMSQPGENQWEETRRIGIPLMAGVFMIPIIFWWFLLRRGYANSTRVAALIYAVVNYAIPVIGGYR